MMPGRCVWWLGIRTGGYMAQLLRVATVSLILYTGNFSLAKGHGIVCSGFTVGATSLRHAPTQEPCMRDAEPSLFLFHGVRSVVDWVNSCHSALKKCPVPPPLSRNSVEIPLIFRELISGRD